MAEKDSEVQVQEEPCHLCGAVVELRHDGPGQALWVCRGCGDMDIAFHFPARIHKWKCTVCEMRYWSWNEPSEQRVCTGCADR